MRHQQLFHESFADAVRETVQVLGGLKKVGAAMRPEMAPEAAARWLADTLNADRRERLDPEQVKFLAKAGRVVGCHAIATYFMREAGYADPVPLEPEDERAQLERDFILAAESLRGIADRLGRLGIKVAA